MLNTSEISALIKDKARELGFSGCGFAQARYLEQDAAHLKKWLSNKFHAGMGYMENHFEKRIDPAKLVDETKSVIALALNYYSEAKYSADKPYKISRYAFGSDYHKVIKKKLKILLEFIHSLDPSAEGRGFVDSAPVMERAWGKLAGLGWVGKNANLISPETGSYFFIGVLFVNIILDYDHPIRDFCGSCTKCLMACPTKAIIAPRIIDSNKCISYLTIENKNEIPLKFSDKMENWIFGCDICQEVCPWNRKALVHKTPELRLLNDYLNWTKEDWHNLSEDIFREKFRHSPIKRAKYSGLKRNIIYLRDAAKDIQD